jgi:asparagine synthase (glutamine-hydrolysing)
MQARGPDDAGVYVHRNLAFAHRRLAIRDLSAGAQPWRSRDGKCVLVYNGEIYNDRALRRELERAGHFFETRCDTEVLMAAWLEWGRDCVRRLRGMFAFGVYDFRDDTLFLARDRFGIKPLFLMDVNGGLAFASSISALLRHPAAVRIPNFAAISHYLTTVRLTLGRDTVYEGIRQLLPAETLTWRDGRARIEKYWEYPAATAESTSFDDAVDQLHFGLKDAVQARLVSDVPVGMFLSGGVDSSTLACFVRQISPAPMIARCGGGDESPDFAPARHSAQHADFDFDEVRVDHREYLDCWQQLLDIYATPLATPTDVILHRLSVEMKKSVGVVLGGEGADELLCGYAIQHWSACDYERARGLAAGVWRETAVGACAFRQALERQYGRSHFASPVDHYFTLNSLIPQPAKARLLQPWVLQATDGDAAMFGTYRELFAEHRHLPLLEQYLVLLHRVNLESLLARLDSSSMLAGLEARVPYTDHLLVEQMFRLPLRFKIDVAPEEPAPYLPSADLQARGSLRSKRLLRTVAGRLLPTALAERPKASFPTPVARWLSEPWKHHVREVIKNSGFGRAVFQQPALNELAENIPAAGMWLWPLLNVLEWGDRQFGDAAGMSHLRGRAIHAPLNAQREVPAPSRVTTAAAALN